MQKGERAKVTNETKDHHTCWFKVVSVRFADLQVHRFAQLLVHSHISPVSHLSRFVYSSVEDPMPPIYPRERTKGVMIKKVTATWLVNICHVRYYRGYLIVLVTCCTVLYNNMFLIIICGVLCYMYCVTALPGESLFRSGASQSSKLRSFAGVSATHKFWRRHVPGLLRPPES